MILSEIKAYHTGLDGDYEKIANLLYKIIDQNLVNSQVKIWHAHPVWFIDDNPIVGYGKLKDCLRLMFWSGQSFKHQGLSETGSFKAAELRLNSVKDVQRSDLIKWLAESIEIQWDYKNIVKRKGRLLRLS